MLSTLFHPFRPVRTLSTPWAVYGVTFSGDGDRLAFGGGSAYGGGGLGVARVRAGEAVITPCGDLPVAEEPGAGRWLSVSGLALTADDRHLVASTWSTRHHDGPALVLEVDGLALVHRETVTPLPPGIVLSNGDLIVRNGSSAIVRRTLATTIDPTPTPHELTSSRLVVIDDHAFTAGHAGLAIVPLDGSAPTELASACEIRAIARHRDGLVTGGSDGELDRWTPAGGTWHRHRVRGLALTRRGGIIGACTLAGDGPAVAVSVGGDLHVFDDSGAFATHSMRTTCKASSIAAHPDLPWVAVGLEREGPPSAGEVAILEIASIEIADAWRTQRVRQLAYEVDQRGPSRRFDPHALSVLADALEQLGAAPHVLAHLRHHDPRVHRCWVVDGLLRRDQ